MPVVRIYVGAEIFSSFHLYPYALCKIKEEKKKKSWVRGYFVTTFSSRAADRGPGMIKIIAEVAEPSFTNTDNIFDRVVLCVAAVASS